MTHKPNATLEIREEHRENQTGLLSIVYKMLQAIFATDRSFCVVIALQLDENDLHQTFFFLGLLKRFHNGVSVVKGLYHPHWLYFSDC